MIKLNKIRRQVELYQALVVLTDCLFIVYLMYYVQFVLYSEYNLLSTLCAIYRLNVKLRDNFVKVNTLTVPLESVEFAWQSNNG